MLRLLRRGADRGRLRPGQRRPSCSTRATRTCSSIPFAFDTENVITATDRSCAEEQLRRATRPGRRSSGSRLIERVERSAGGRARRRDQQAADEGRQQQLDPASRAEPTTSRSADAWSSAPGSAPATSTRWASPLHLRLDLRGPDEDNAEPSGSLVVNQRTWSITYFPETDPIGQVIRPNNAGSRLVRHHRRRRRQRAPVGADLPARCPEWYTVVPGQRLRGRTAHLDRALDPFEPRLADAGDPARAIHETGPRPCRLSDPRTDGPGPARDDRRPRQFLTDHGQPLRRDRPDPGHGRGSSAPCRTTWPSVRGRSACGSPSARTRRRILAMVLREGLLLDACWASGLGRHDR